MGFSSALQSRVAHEALVVRLDAELRLMETMKRSIQLKAKFDKEYAINLATVAQQGLKIDRADDLQGSLITKSWRSYMDELDQQAKQFKANAEQLEVVCEKLSHLSQDKRKARKAYQEEHAKIAARLNHLTDEVVRKKAEYQKNLEGYKTLRTRFEEHYIKSGRSGRKLDDVRDKYQKACRKLHLTHNEYVLSITEAIEVEKDFRTVLLPGVLEHQQSLQESFILLWRKILLEAIHHGDLTCDKFKEIQKRIDSVINNINPNEEYREFTEKHKTSPTPPHLFQFDESLIEDIPGKLHANTLTVDNLTVDWLRSRLVDLEQSVKECQEKQIKLTDHSNGGSPIANGGSIHSNGSNPSTPNGIPSLKDNQSRQSKDLTALRCQEKQKQKLVDMIKSALNEVGCEELPSGCDDHLAIDQNFIENSFSNDQQPSSASTMSTGINFKNALMRKGGVFTLLRGKHFKRKSTPQPRTPTARLRTEVPLKLQQRSQSLGSLSVNTSPSRYETITNPLRMAASVEANNNHGLHDFDPDVAIFSPIVWPKLKRAELSLLCLREEELLTSSLSLKNFEISSTNNNNIYSELKIGSDIMKDMEPIGPKQREETFEMINKAQDLDLKEVSSENIIIEHCSALEECENDSSNSKGMEQNDEEQEEAKDGISEELVKNSIDAHLDRIDELNRVLDDRLKTKILMRNQQLILDLDAIESAEQIVQTRNKLIEELASPSAKKRLSSSSSECCTNLSTKPSSFNKNNTNINNTIPKKRSLSFTQKSFNNILTNIKEFSKSPLSRIHKVNNPHNSLPEVNEILHESSENNKGQNNEPLTLIKSAPLNETEIVQISNVDIESTTEDNMKYSSNCLTSSNTSKLKFRVPKIQKKSQEIRNTFRSKFINLQMKKSKHCKTCTKRRQIHPSKSVFDFAKEFDLNDANENDSFCTCPIENRSKSKKMTNSSTNTEPNFSTIGNGFDADDDLSDDVLSVKDHCYCVPTLATNVSRVKTLTYGNYNTVVHYINACVLLEILRNNNQIH